MNLTALEGPIVDLQRRIADACVSDNRPLFLHWSDAELLSETLRALREQEMRIKNVERALGLAMTLVK